MDLLKDMGDNRVYYCSLKSTHTYINFSHGAVRTIKNLIKYRIQNLFEKYRFYVTLLTWIRYTDQDGSIFELRILHTDL